MLLVPGAVYYLLLFFPFFLSVFSLFLLVVVIVVFLFSLPSSLQASLRLPIEHRVTPDPLVDRGVHGMIGVNTPVFSLKYALCNESPAHGSCQVSHLLQEQKSSRGSEDCLSLLRERWLCCLRAATNRLRLSRRQTVSRECGSPNSVE